MSKKKILIIWYEKLTNERNGGIETYIKNFVIFSKIYNYDIDFFYLDKKKINRFTFKKAKCTKNNIVYLLCKSVEILFNKIFRFFWNLKVSKKISKKKYDLIINHTWFKFSSILIRDNNFYQMQHFDYMFYTRSFLPNLKFFNFFYRIGYYIINDRLIKNNNLLTISKNLICFSNNPKYFELNKNSFPINIPIKEYFFKNRINEIENKNYSFCYIGRLNEEQKNISLIPKIFDKLNYTIDVYGDGEDKKVLENKKNINLKGIIINDDIPRIVSNSYTFFILTSNTEGCPTIALELMSIGLIGIIRNSFLEAKSIIPKNYHDLLLVDKNSNEKDFIKKINYITALDLENLETIRKDLICHMKENYSFGKFSKSWKELIERKKIN